MTQDTHLNDLLKGTRRKSNVRRIILIIILLLLAGGAFFAVQYWRQRPAQSGVPSYKTVPVTRGDLISSISATGTVEAINTVEVGAEISGRILSLNADFNDSVTIGQVLATIDPEQHIAQVAQAKAQMLAADAQVAEAEATLQESRLAEKRTRELAEKGLISSKELESATAKATRAKASLKSARASAALSRASLDSAKSKLSKTEIISPISGMVLSREVEVGQTINAGMQTPVLFIIAEDLKRMRLSSSVDEADIGRVKKGQSATFTVDAFPTETFKSMVTAVRNVPTTDQNVVSYEVLLSVDNQRMLLKPGMTASVEITTEKLTDVLLVENKALRFTPQSGFGRGMRGPIPFFGGRRGKKGAGHSINPVKKVGKLKDNQGLLWRLDKESPPGTLRPVKVDKLATNGIKSAIASDKIEDGELVVVEQTTGDAAP